MPIGDPLPGRDLAAFVTAVETGTVQGAADALDLTQSAASKRLQTLERRVGRVLLQRSSSGVRPTAAGAALYPLAREALATLERAEVAVMAPGDAPVLRLQASRTVGETLLPGWLTAFRAQAPPCRVSASVTNSEQVVLAVRDGDAEIGFIEGPAGSMHGLQDLVVADDEIRVVVGADHPWARRRAIRPADLAAEPFLAREAGSGTRSVPELILAEAGIHLRPALEISSSEGLKRAVLSGGFTLLSERVVATEVAAGTHSVVPMPTLRMRRSLRAVRRRRPALVGPARTFWRWLERATAAQRDDRTRA